MEVENQFDLSIFVVMAETDTQVFYAFAEIVAF